jgi:hypothetical protein
MSDVYIFGPLMYLDADILTFGSSGVDKLTWHLSSSFSWNGGGESSTRFESKPNEREPSANPTISDRDRRIGSVFHGVAIQRQRRNCGL